VASSPLGSAVPLDAPWCSPLRRGPVGDVAAQYVGIYERMDRNHDGSISCEEFVAFASADPLLKALLIDRDDRAVRRICRHGAPPPKAEIEKEIAGCRDALAAAKASVAACERALVQLGSELAAAAAAPPPGAAAARREHGGDWRDTDQLLRFPGGLPFKEWCSADLSEGQLCRHGAAEITTSHYSCCGKTSRASECAGPRLAPAAAAPVSRSHSTVAALLPPPVPKAAPAAAAAAARGAAEPSAALAPQDLRVGLKVAAADASNPRGALSVAGSRVVGVVVSCARDTLCMRYSIEVDPLDRTERCAVYDVYHAQAQGEVRRDNQAPLALAPRIALGDRVRACHRRAGDARCLRAFDSGLSGLVERVVEGAPGQASRFRVVQNKDAGAAGADLFFEEEIVQVPPRWADEIRAGRCAANGAVGVVPIRL
jgi:hypothetical protein